MCISQKFSLSFLFVEEGGFFFPDLFHKGGDLDSTKIMDLKPYFAVHMPALVVTSHPLSSFHIKNHTQDRPCLHPLKLLRLRAAKKKYTNRLVRVRIFHNLHNTASALLLT